MRRSPSILPRDQAATAFKTGISADRRTALKPVKISEVSQLAEFSLVWGETKLPFCAKWPERSHTIYCQNKSKTALISSSLRLHILMHFYWAHICLADILKVRLPQASGLIYCVLCGGLGSWVGAPRSGGHGKNHHELSVDPQGLFCRNSVHCSLEKGTFFFLGWNY